MRGWFWLGVALGTQGCFYYDSTWGQAEEEQRRSAGHHSGAKLSSAGGGTALRRQARQLDVRVLATREHTAEVYNWQKRFSDTLTQANEILRPGYGVELRVQTFGSWHPTGLQDDLSALLDELQRTDPGEDVAWVVGLVGSLQRVEYSFHQLGMATFPGKHLVLRASSDAAEYDAIRAGFRELSEAEQKQLYTSRRQHKSTAILLHELAHSVGAIHVTRSEDLMHPLYSTEMQSFGVDSQRLLRPGFEARTNTTAPDSKLAAALVEQLQTRQHDWVPTEHAEAVARLSRFAPQAPPPVPRNTVPRNTVAQKTVAQSTAAQPAALQATAPLPSLLPVAQQGAPPRSGNPGRVFGQQPGAASHSPAVASAPLAGVDQARVAKALALLQSGNAAAAATEVGDLFERYPDHLEVQDLRCQLALGLNLDWERTRAECARLMQLQGAQR